ATYLKVVGNGGTGLTDLVDPSFQHLFGPADDHSIQLQRKVTHERPQVTDLPDTTSLARAWSLPFLVLEQALASSLLKGQETGAELFEVASSVLKATRLFFVEARRNLFEFNDLCLELSEPLP